MPNLEVSYAALTDDARTWDDIAEVLSTSKGYADTATISAQAWPTITGVAVGSAYDTLREKVATVLEQGQTETTRIADKLIDIRRDYESTDQAEEAQYQDMWEPLGS